MILTYDYKLLARFKAVDYNLKMHIKSILGSLFLPETTSLCPSLEKVNIKGALKKVERLVRSTKQLPSLWKHIDARDPDTYVSQSKSTCSSRKIVRAISRSHYPNPLPVQANFPHTQNIVHA